MSEQPHGDDSHLIGVPMLHSRVAEEFARSITESPAMQVFATRMVEQLVPAGIFDETTMARIRAYGTELRGTLDAVLPPLNFDAAAVVRHTDSAEVQWISGQGLPEWAEGLMANSPAKVVAVAVGLFQLLLATLPEHYDAPPSAGMLTVVWTMAWILATAALKEQ